MGNRLGKLFCVCSREEIQPEETPNIGEEIPMQMLDETEDHIYETVDTPEYMNMRGQVVPYESMENMPDSPKEDPNETFRFRIMAEHFGCPNRQLKIEYRQIYDTLVPINSTLNSDKMQCIFHISVYNSHKERVVDMTIIKGLSPDSMMEHVIYWKDSQEDSWRFNFSSQEGRRLYKQYRISPVKRIFVWAITDHIKNNSEVNKVLLLSKKPSAISVPSHIKESAGCVLHITAYNLQLTRTLDVILIQGKKNNSDSECYIQWRDPNTETAQFTYTGVNTAEGFWNFFN